MSRSHLPHSDLLDGGDAPPRMGEGEVVAGRRDRGDVQVRVAFGDLVEKGCVDGLVVVADEEVDG